MPRIRVIPLDTKSTAADRPAAVHIDMEYRDNLLAALIDGGVMVGNDCGGNGQCATCRVRVESADFVLPNMTMAESYALSRARKSGVVRLACQICVEGDMSVEILDHGESDED